MKQPNQLIHEKSPYLLQHAYNPVNWYPWGKEAFEKAKREDKPIFLSIGYSTCHWCHVMNKESFEDETVAKLLNEHYVSIKVDREERPDIDHIYMTVCQAMTGHGGWPLTILMTPDQKPFFAGTYFPKEDKHGRLGLISLLERVAMLWKEERAKAESTGDKMMEGIKAYLDSSGVGEWNPEVFDYAFEQFASQFDDLYGGFGIEPKFPRPYDLLFLLRYYKQTKEEEALHFVTHTLERMRRGGIFDHLGYGFSRYAVDREWLIPHFEKMLYDQALLVLAYLEAYQVTQDPFFAQVSREIFTYVLRDLRSPEGAFYSAEDADSEGEEGKFYVWTPREIKEVLGEEDGQLFCEVYEVTEEGNFENGTSVLNQIHFVPEQVEENFGMSLEELEKKLEKLREKLLKARDKRVRPHRDDKILTSWNGLMIAALARGGRVLDEMEYIEAAAKAAEFIMENLTRKEDGRLLARYRDGEAAYLGYLDDYAFFIWGLIEMYEATFQGMYLKQALKLTQSMIHLFKDSEKGGFYFYGHDAEKLIARPKEVYDGATPSGNSVAAYNLLKLARLTLDEELQKEADQQLQTFAQTVEASPISHSFFLIALQFAHGAHREIVISGKPNDAHTKEMIRVVQKAYLPNTVFAFDPRGEDPNTVKYWIPRVDGINEETEKAKAYICENFACQAPISDLSELKQQLQL